MHPRKARDADFKWQEKCREIVKRNTSNNNRSKKKHSKALHFALRSLKCKMHGYQIYHPCSLLNYAPSPFSFNSAVGWYAVNYTGTGLHKEFPVEWKWSPSQIHHFYTFWITLTAKYQRIREKKKKKVTCNAALQRRGKYLKKLSRAMLQYAKRPWSNLYKNTRMKLPYFCYKKQLC